MHFTKTCLFAILLMLLTANWGCSEDGLSTTFHVPKEFLPYVDRFLEEASRRGIDINTSHLSIDFRTNVGDVDAGGECEYNRSRSYTQINLDTTLLWWRYGDLTREAVIFHELGHCLLQRSHLDDLLPNGERKSIMATSGPFSYVDLGIANFNFSYKRDYYINELFDTDTPAPCWIDELPASHLEVNVVTEADELLNMGFGKIVADGSGNIWMIVGNIIYKFNGISFQAINQDAMNLPQHQYFISCLDQMNKLWLLSMEKTGPKQDMNLYIHRLNDEGKFDTVHIINIEQMADLFPTTFAVDNAENVWIGSIWHGLIAVGNDDHIRHFHHENSDLPMGVIRQIYVNSPSKVYMLLNDELVILSENTSFQSIIPAPLNDQLVQFHGLALQHDEKLYLYAEEQLWRYTTEQGLEPLDMTRFNMPYSRINSLELDHLGRLVANTEHGMRVLLNNRWFTDYCQFNLGEDEPEIRSVAFENGNIWVITDKILKINPVN